MNKTVKILIVVIVAIVLIASGVIGFILVKSTPEKEEPRFIYDPGTSFVTNVQDDKALVKSTLVIQVVGKDTTEKLTENSVQVRDSIISVLRQKTKDEMMSEDIQETLKTEICNRLTEDTGIEGIETIYFSEFVVQQ
jgi:flagellar FliL protein